MDATCAASLLRSTAAFEAANTSGGRRAASCTGVKGGALQPCVRSGLHGLPAAHRVRVRGVRVQGAVAAAEGVVQVVGRQRRVRIEDAKQCQQIWANELALIHAKYLAHAILDNSKSTREACAVGKGAAHQPPLQDAFILIRT